MATKKPTQRRLAVALSVALVVALAGSALLFHKSSPTGRYNTAVLAHHPVAFWNMQASHRTEADLSGHGHSGTYIGGRPTLTTLPDGSRAATFNGHGEYMTARSSAVFLVSTTGQLTWEAWIRPSVLQWSRASNPSGDGYVDWMGKCAHYSPSCEWEARMYSSVNRARRCNRISAYVFKPTAGLGSAADWQPSCKLLRPGQWLYVVGEYQTRSTPPSCNGAYQGTINIWVNGVEWNRSGHGQTGCMSQYGVTPRASYSPLTVGTMARDTWFPGAVAKVALYDKLLNQAQIDKHFAAMTGARPSGSCSPAGCTVPVPTP